MKSMNDTSDVAMHGGALATLLSSLMGLTTMEMFYIIIAVIGAFISLLGYLDKRKTESLSRN